MWSILRVVRGALGTGVTWAMAWAIAGLAVFAVVFGLMPGLDGFGSVAALLAAICGASGFTAGLVFSGVLATIYRRRPLSDLDPRALGAWGAAAGLVLPAWFLLGSLSAGILIEAEAVVVLLATTAIFGATTASGTVALAQSGSETLHAERSNPLLPQADH